MNINELIKETVKTLEWMITDMQWKADQTKLNFEEGSQGGYSKELNKASEILEEWKELENKS